MTSRRTGSCSIGLLLLALIAATALPAAAQSGCAGALLDAFAASELDGPQPTTEWIDEATPNSSCTASPCFGVNSNTSADPACSEVLQLVFSDEFEAPGQQFDVAASNPRWTAERMWYGATEDIEVYVPQQVTTTDGAAVVTIDRAGEQNATALGQRPDGTVWNVSSAYQSGFVTSWNKFCFTGGYVEARLQLPGNDFASGFWPALWLMGNLGRAGYLATTKGFWPFSYNSCGGGDVGPSAGGADPPVGQNITACPDPPGFDRTKFGLLPGQGRGAPEIDMLEVMVGSSRKRKPGSLPPPPAAPGQQVYPHALMTLQAGPLLPNGTTWTENGNEPGPGMYLAKDGLPDGMMTDLAWWQGPFAPAGEPQYRPGSLFQDAVSAYASLDPSFWTQYHTFGLYWEPGEILKWYIDGTLVYSVDKEALREQTNSTGYTVHQRLIPQEPAYVIFNVAMSNSFGYVDLQKLPFPSEMKVDYVRVYQNPAKLNIGCSPADHPTEQYLACNRDKYLLTAEDAALINGTCMGAPSCTQEANMNLQGGDIPDGSGGFVQPLALATAKDCCQACQGLPACGAYVYSTSEQKCFLKLPTGWTRVPVDDPTWGALAGQVYDAGQSYPRGTTPPPPPSAASRASTCFPLVGWLLVALLAARLLATA
ncbi:hypothetical protein ABPG77_000830 [Micractinium sp. CCAP 211/92]